MKWSYHEACLLATKLNGITISYGYAMGLTGSCLFAGCSDNDVDLLIYPLTHEKAQHYSIVVNEIGKYLSANKISVAATGREPDDKVVFTFMLPDKRRVELFVPHLKHKDRVDTFETYTGETSVDEDKGEEIK